MSAPYDPATCAERYGKLTASKAAIIMGGLETSGLATYVKQCAWARVYGPEEETFKSAAMERGTVLESSALDYFEFERDVTLRRTPGFFVHPQLPYVGASPDALVMDGDKPARVVECKCPLSSAFMEVKRAQQVPSEYRHQIRWQLWVMGLREADFVAFHPAAGGIILAMTVTDAECDQMAERSAIVDAMVRKWVDILTDRREAA